VPGALIDFVRRIAAESCRIVPKPDPADPTTLALALFVLRDPGATETSAANETGVLDPTATGGDDSREPERDLPVRSPHPDSQAARLSDLSSKLGRTVGRSRWSAFAGARRTAVVVVLLVPIAAFSFARPAAAATAWSGSGSGTTTVVNDGTSGSPQFTYSLQVSCCASGSWTFSTTSNVSGSVVLPWSYSGFNAYAGVTVHLNAFVTSGGSTTTLPLVNAGPVNCCTAPSGGFSYSGTTTLSVQPGDSYGFTMSGSNGDSNGHLDGALTITALTVTATTSTLNRSGYCAGVGDSNPFTGQPILPGAFLDLVRGHPASDPRYQGATPALFVAGKGITCDAPPAGYVQTGYQGIYPYFTSTG
jgi:hypothetical protein